MTETEKILTVKAMVGDSDSDETLAIYLRLAGQKIINRAFPYDQDVEEVPKRYSTLQCEIAAYMLNKRGAEGQTAHTENGIKVLRKCRCSGIHVINRCTTLWHDSIGVRV